MKNKPYIGIACSIFRKEIELLQKNNQLDIPFKYIGSMLHMNPEILDKSIAKLIQEECDNNIILVYGDCCPHINDIECYENVARVSGTNCCEILLGTKRYRELRSEKVFFLIPEWTLRWKEIFQFHFGLEGENAISFMNEMFNKLVYLDTGLFPIPERHLIDISTYCDLPIEVMEISLKHLVSAILETKERHSDYEHYGQQK